MIAVLWVAAGLVVLALALRTFQGAGTSGALDQAMAGVKALLIPIVNLINEPAFVYLASLTIVLSAAILIVYDLRLVIEPERRAMRLAEIKVAALPAVPQGIGESLLAIGAILESRNVLLPSWTTYVQEARTRGRLPSRRFADYVIHDPSSPLGRQGGAMAALPGYYTTFGLILTFIGLVVALYFAARGFRSGDMNEARQSIIQLLNASAFKFLTSVAALSSALAISIAYRIGRSRLRAQAFRLVAVIQARLQAYELLEANPGKDDADRPLLDKLDEILAELRALRGAAARADAHAPP